MQSGKARKSEPGEAGKTFIHQYDLATKQLMTVYSLEDTLKNHHEDLFNTIYTRGVPPSDLLPSLQNQLRPDDLEILLSRIQRELVDFTESMKGNKRDFSEFTQKIAQEAVDGNTEARGYLAKLFQWRNALREHLTEHPKTPAQTSTGPAAPVISPSPSQKERPQPPKGTDTKVGPEALSHETGRILAVVYPEPSTAPFDDLDFRYAEDRARLVEIGVLEQDEVDVMLSFGMGSFTTNAADSRRNLYEPAKIILEHRRQEDFLLEQHPAIQNGIQTFMNDRGNPETLRGHLALRMLQTELKNLNPEDQKIAATALRRKIREVLLKEKVDAGLFSQLDQDICSVLGIDKPSVSEAQNKTEFMPFPVAEIVTKLKDRIHPPMPFSQALSSYTQAAIKKYGKYSTTEQEHLTKVASVLEKQGDVSMPIAFPISPRKYPTLRLF